MASTTNKPFHSYENVGFEEQTKVTNHYVQPNNAIAPTPMMINNGNMTSTPNNAASGCSSGIAINKTAIGSPFEIPPIMNGKMTPLHTR